MVFTREVLESYYKFLSSHVLSLPDTVVALFSVAQQKPDMYPYWLDPQDYSDCFYDFWIFMNFYYKGNKSEFYNLVKNMEFLSEKIWNEFIREDTIDNLFKYHFLARLRQSSRLLGPFGPQWARASSGQAAR
jgi:hypothetical protein